MYVHILSQIFNSHPFKAIFWIGKIFETLLGLLLRCRLNMKLQGSVPNWRVYYSWSTCITMIGILLISCIYKRTCSTVENSEKNNHKEENKHKSLTYHLERTISLGYGFLNYTHTYTHTHICICIYVYMYVYKSHF